MHILGLDVGGTKTEAAVIKLGPGSAYKILARSRIPTHRQDGAKAILGEIKGLCLRVLEQAKIKGKQLDGIGVGLPGSVNPKTGRMLFGNTLSLIDQDVAGFLKSALKTNARIVCENDANCFAYAESFWGAGMKHSAKSKNITSVGVILGTGVGGGIIANGALLRGRIGGAGEIGHTELYTAGHSCYCGRNGCAENYLSGTALESHFASRIYSQISQRPNAAGVLELARNGDPIACAVVLQYQKDLAKFLGTITNILDPAFIVLGGGMSNAPEVYEGLEKRIAENSFLPKAGVKVYRNMLGDSAGVIGAAMLSVK